MKVNVQDIEKYADLVCEYNPQLEDLVVEGSFPASTVGQKASLEESTPASAVKPTLVVSAVRALPDRIFRPSVHDGRNLGAGIACLRWPKIPAKNTTVL